jgi:AmmeMemoRadiSam system protein B
VEVSAMNIREAAVAGMFYPASAPQLSAQVDNLMSGFAAAGRVPKALIAPHAGYAYSGTVAGAVYSRVRGVAAIRRVVLVGPSHRVAFSGIALPDAQVFRTPLGDVDLDTAAIERLLRVAGVSRREDAHLLEHSLEVQLPFLQIALGDFLLIPMVVGLATPETVATAIEAVWGGSETLVVISSDLSHFHPYAAAEAIDAATSRKIIDLQSGLGPEQACGCTGINALLSVARRRGLGIEEVDRCNSGDTAGSRDQVVGYAAYALYEN